MNSFLRRSLAVALLSVGALLLVIVSADAVVYGVPDGTGHPNAGGLVYPQAFSDGTWIYCSGTLISPTVFLTAAHCDIGSSRVTVTFDSAYQDGDKTFVGTWHADPLYGHDESDPHDLAVVVFDKPIKGITPAVLPAAGSLSNLPSNQQITSVGYGAFEVTNQPGGHRYLYNDVRGAATGTLNSITPFLAPRFGESRYGEWWRLLRRFRWPEFSCRHQHDRRHHDYGRRHLSFHEYKLSARYKFSAVVPEAICRSAVAAD